MGGDLIAFDASVGDELTVEAEFHIDGIEIIEAFESKKKRPMPETLEVLGSGRDQPLVTTQLVPNRKNRDGSRDRDRGDRRGRQDRRGRGDQKDRDRQAPRREDDHPKAKRLRPGRTHRQELIDSLPEEQKPVAEKMVRDGISSVEKALQIQRKKARDAAKAEKVAAKAETDAAKAEKDLAQTGTDRPKAEEEEKLDPKEAVDDFLAAAGKLLSRVRAAEWRDQVEAALADIDEIDLRDLRSVVVASEAGAADDEAKAMAEELRAKLTERVDREHAEWLAEVAATLADGRMVRALRLSSRPPKAGVPLPQDMVTRLTEAANAALASDTPTKRWIAVLGAVAFSPVRRTVQPQGVPDNPDKELLAEVTKLSERVPHIAALFGVEPTPPPKRPRRGSGAQTPSRASL